jgi:multidrug transporter EmrE-like cation transporter
MLSVAILAEVIGTVALKYAEGFTRPFPSLIVVLGYGLAFFLLSRVVQTIPLAVAYAVWSGAGIALIGIIGWVFVGQRLDWAALIGIGLIIGGVVVINLFSSSITH